ncbi:putative myosin heavy chain [Toxoplasma gondii GT1]|uniref:Putative myosin heavy chain n=2 Tax=Toxoplasma gondii TaxID=5811 RepID=S7W7F1_TOXGG|nr:Chain L, ATPTG8 [Toxoplasma gondii GT1]6TMG_l Chain l, ATPTG8 [Toxoplasma gondii GT1]6TMK_L Chain L, ATPTG8 [Toxoplasma gondii GT1]6TMK_l Chain l, ATPTG8 [Toxoplasma gondii GT1]6TML_L7 Chain L7, ATPTG8 [Toxoplasma gondii GT1]6TML_L8 Chain L8, ATPTG8 [Toxoplasma gondii GT1]6TML_L9 Chain L9, ATPTG8 [Toxoplasma gondii GT1]6TML_l7 Chain l7, ATPTG8 [Toxoplasma gondii GT1]6TML_l8 Chain l8, ATPTG8 [Toxoplasma gondii GT1]6TML_l9 Chain l9, ATPTG8 [Toxoplasma gondii GT1]KAF4641383.1 putative myo
MTALPPPPSANVAVSFTAAPAEPLSRGEVKAASLKLELQNIERELKDWWMSRKILRDRNIGLFNLLQHHNFAGLSVNNAKLSDSQRVMWTDLVQGKPDVEDKLSVDAREMKVDMYEKLFKQAADLENPCRMPGVAYLRCLRDTLTETQSARRSSCLNAFSSFDACRTGLLKQQSAAVENSLVRQNMADVRAKALFERRAVLLDLVEGK